MTSAIPFDAGLLDRLMDEAGLDVLFATSKHNVQYLLGGYRFFFFDSMDAIGVSRYLPVLVYPKGMPEKAAYFGSGMESFEHELGRFWPSHVETTAWGTIDAIDQASSYIRALLPAPRIGIEMSFLPLDAGLRLQKNVPAAELVDAFFALERLRAIKTPTEIDCLRTASEEVVAAMLGALEQCKAGMTKVDFVHVLKREQVARGLAFDYCLITAGSSHNRAPSPQQIVQGDILSIDSGANFRGYIGDLARMGIVGEPDTELRSLLAVVDAVQQNARSTIKPGTTGTSVYAAAGEVINETSHAPCIHFMAHGMGLVSHEAPRLWSNNPVPYSGYDQDRPLQAGMVVSVETTMSHPTRGYVKLEDTILVTEDGHESLGDGGRGWNVAGQG